MWGAAVAAAQGEEPIPLKIKLFLDEASVRCCETRRKYLLMRFNLYL